MFIMVFMAVLTFKMPGNTFVYMFWFGLVETMSPVQPPARPGEAGPYAHSSQLGRGPHRGPTPWWQGKARQTPCYLGHMVLPGNVGQVD